MHVITYSTNFAPPHFAAGGIPKNTPHGTMEDHTGYSLLLPDGAFFFFSLHKAHTFTRPDILCDIWKRWGDAVPMGKLLLLPVRLRDVNVPISWCTKIRLKVTCLFPCAVQGDDLSGHIRWKSSQDTHFHVFYYFTRSTRCRCHYCNRLFICPAWNRNSYLGRTSLYRKCLSPGMLVPCSFTS